MRNALLLILALAAMMVPAFAQPQTMNIPLKPSYIEKIAANDPMTFMLPLSGFSIGKVSNAILAFDINIDPSQLKMDPHTVFYIMVDKQECINSKFDFIGTGSGSIKFDCSNVISDPSIDYAVELRASGDLNSISAQGYVTYEIPATEAPSNLTDTLQSYFNSNPVNDSVLNSLKSFYMRKASMHVSGTDYFSGENATVFLQLIDIDGNPVNNASCKFDMYNTTNPLSTPIYSNQPMVFRGADGIYYYQFSLTGIPSGTYPVDASCAYIYDNFYYYSGLLQAPNVTTNSGTFQGGDAVNLNAYDSLYMEWTGTPNITMIWRNVTNSGNITSIDFYWAGEESAVRTLTFYAFNYTSSSYNIILGTKVTNAGGGSATPNGNDELFTAAVPAAAYNGTTVSVQMTVSGTGNLFMNWATLKAYRNSTYTAETRGSSEVHIFPQNLTLNISATATVNSTDIASNVWNFTNRTLTQNVSVDITPILSRLDQMNSTLNQILYLSQQLNLTTQQTLILAQTINLTTAQILALAQQINLTTNSTASNVVQMLVLSQQINLTTNQTQALLSYMNISLAQVLSLSSQINITTLQNKGLLEQINMTTLYNKGVLDSLNLTIPQILGIVQSMNLTQQQMLYLLQQLNASSSNDTAFLTSINNTVSMNAATLASILVLATTINATTFQNFGLLVEVNGSVYDINITTLQSLGLLNQINGTVNISLATINSIFDINQNINQTVYLDYLLNQQINGTVNYNKAKLDQLNLTADQIYSLLQGVNVNIIGNTFLLNNISSSIVNLSALASHINLTTEQTYALLQNLSVGNISVVAIVNSSAIAEAVWNANVTEYQISPAPPVGSGFSVTGAATLGGIAYASPTDSGVNSVCIDNATLMNFVVRTRCVNDACSTVQTNATMACQFGCNDQELPNSCNPSPSQTNWYFVGIILAILLIVIVAVAKLR